MQTVRRAPLLEAIERAFHSARALVHHVRVDHRRLDARVAGQLLVAESLGEIPLVKELRALEMFFEGRNDRVWKKRDAVFRPLAVAHDDLTIFEVDVLDSQPQAFAKTKAGAVEQTRHQPSVSRETREQALRLRGGEHGGNAGRFAHSLQAFEPRKRHGQNLLVEEKERRQGLILRRGGDPAITGQMVEKRRDLGRPQIPGVPLSVEVDEAPDPVKISLLRAQTVVQAANRLPNLLQQARLRRGLRNIVHTASPRKSRFAFWTRTALTP